MKLSEAARALSDAGIENARGEAITIFTELGGLSRLDMIGCDPVSNLPEVISAVERRKSREPLQYVLGEVDFYKEHYAVSPSCLIPRPDTELLVDYAVKSLPAGANFIDLCTGSGCVAISTLANTKETTATAVELSPRALAAARKNAETNGVFGRIKFIEADVLQERVRGDFYAVLSNPPYVTENAYCSLEPELYHEPKMALVGTDDDGAGFYRRITELYLDVVERGGFIAFEIGYDQGCALRQIASKHGVKCEIIKDFGGNDRVAVLKN